MTEILGGNNEVSSAFVAKNRQSSQIMIKKIKEERMSQPNWFVHTAKNLVIPWIDHLNLLGFLTGIEGQNRGDLLEWLQMWMLLKAF